MYKVYVDGQMVYEANNVRTVKKEAQIFFDLCNAFKAVIIRGNQAYAYKKYDSDWQRIYGPAKGWIPEM